MLGPFSRDLNDVEKFPKIFSLFWENSVNILVQFRASKAMELRSLLLRLQLPSVIKLEYIYFFLL